MTSPRRNRQRTIWATALLGCGLAWGAIACEPSTPPPENHQAQQVDVSGLSPDDALHQIIATHELAALEPIERDPKLVLLGKSLFFDPILSGNMDTSCATCHHPTLGTGDDLALGIGTGSTGLGSERRDPTNIKQIIPRNATELYNRGDPEWRTMFWDIRIEEVPGGILTPAGFFSRDAVRDVLTVQSLFPVFSRDEMRGYPDQLTIHDEDNEVSRTHDMDFSSVWRLLMKRLSQVPAYREAFEDAYEAPFEDLHFIHAANALAAFKAVAFSFVDSPWDRYVRGDPEALSDAEKSGALLFFGKGNCAACHSGNLFTDQRAHNIAVPQIGPGRRPSGPLDLGRFAVVAAPENRFAFRTPPLRNVTLTGPYMHNGAYRDLSDAVRHHFDPVGMMERYDPSQLSPYLFPFAITSTRPVAKRILENVAPQLPVGVALSDDEFSDLMAFLHALTDPETEERQLLNIPDQVPSGLPVVGP